MPDDTKAPSILLVEDSEDDVFFFNRALKRSGTACSLHYVTNGDEAVNFLRAANKTAGHPFPRLIFLDLKMPILNGFEVLNWMNTQSFREEVQVIVLSGSDQQGDKERAAELGASGYLVKPVTAADLSRHLQGICPATAESGANS